MITENLESLASAFRMRNFEIRIVGGAVRDYLLGMDPKDIDLCTDATPDEMIEIANDYGFKYIPTGLQHGTITIVVGSEPFEVTTLRIDVETDGRHAEVEFTRDFEQDAARRDLTINAMSMDISTRKIYDYFDGRSDLKDGRVRFVGDPDARVKEDYLRILRYFRFMARFGFSIENLNEIKIITSPENLKGLESISVERYWMELSKLVISPYANDILENMYYHGVLNTLGLGKPRIDNIGASPIGILSTMLDENTIEPFLDKWKLSSDEVKHLRYLIDSRYKSIRWEFALVDGIPREWVVDYCMIMWPNRGMEYRIRTWKIPVFPITGQDLLDMGMKQGPHIGIILNDLRNKWKASNFKLTKEDLIGNWLTKELE